MNLPSQINFTDTHVHLDFPDYGQDFDEMIERALNAGVKRFISIGAGGGDGIGATQRALALATKYEFVFASAGIHPHDAEAKVDYTELRNYASSSRVVAIGETGLDFFKDWADSNCQKKAFIEQIAIAKELKKPLIIHCRNAIEDCLKIIKAERAFEVGGVFHCFSETVEVAAELRDLNFYVSFPGTLTFKNAESVRAVAKEVPLEQILLETDGPYMSPEPVRGKRCESAFLVHTANKLAEIKNIDISLVAEVTEKNTNKVFNLNKI
jgi:TatD DNase family protein